MTLGAVRAGMVPVTGRVRAYFAPVNRAASLPTIFDPSKIGTLDLESPPTPWIDLGWVENFERMSNTATEALLTGSPALPKVQHRPAIYTQVEFDLRHWGKLQMALAAGSQHMNVLLADPAADPQPSGGTPVAAVAVLAGSTASELVVGVGAISAFQAGDTVVVDVDYNQEVGFIGTAISGAYVRDPMDVLRDANYVRRVSFNVARVAQTTATSLLLAQPLIGGTPADGASLQKVVAFVDRECGSFLQEWSGLFVYQEQAGGRVCFYYPRLSPSNPRRSVGEGFPRETRIPISHSIDSLALHAAFVALPFKDQADSEQVLSFRYYFPARDAAIY